MKTELHTKGINLTEDQNKYVEKKLQKISSMWKVVWDDSSIMRVTIEQLKAEDKNHNVSCHIVINLPMKRVITTTELWRSVSEAVDLAESAILAQIEHTKKHFEK